MSGITPPAQVDELGQQSQSSVLFPSSSSDRCRYHCVVTAYTLQEQARPVHDAARLHVKTSP